MADRIFVYDQLGAGAQPCFPVAVRSETNDVELAMHNPDLVVIRFIFVDVPDAANRVTPRFTDVVTGDSFVDEVPVEGPNVNQTYLLGHRLVVPSGVVGKITGQTEGPGQGVMVDYDLDITMFDQLLARGVTGHSLLVPAHFIIEMIHDGSAPITYSALMTVGQLSGR